MTGSAITITTNADQVAGELQVIAERCGNMLPAMQIIGETGVASIQQNFMAGGRPNGWQPLSPVTLAKKKGGSILVGQGQAGGLLGSIHAEPAADHVLIGTDKVYAAIHQFGGQAGRGRKVTIPARPYLMLQDEDWQEIKDQLADYIVMGTK
jgi:phage virion morphogenesis protein